MNTCELYLRNAFISLVSAKKYSDKDTDVVLIINVSLSKEWMQLFTKENIDVKICPFNEYRLEGYDWELAFYKLCAIKYVLTLEYDYYIQIDSDTIFIRDTNAIFEEAKEKSLLMYEIPYDINQPMRKLINSDYRDYTGKEDVISQWGGEFIASDRKSLSQLHDLIHYYYDKYMLRENKAKEIGDEYFLSLAVRDMANVRNATPYISREWTRGRAYAASARYADPQCVILHLISEKAYGLNYLFSYYLRHHNFPALTKIAKICNLPRLKGHSINRYVISVWLSSLWNKIVS